MGVGLPLLLGLVHVALVAPRYHVGSFDDDASYILTARALLAGQALTGHVASGETVVSLYAPGYSALLVPLVWLWPHSFIPLRVLSALSYAAVFPLTWVFLGRRRLGFGLRMAALAVMALGPPFATYASMVMAEAPFIVVLLLLLLALDRWLDEDRALSRAGIYVVILSAGLVWLKEAGLGLIGGLFLWLLIARHPRRLARAALLGAGVGLLLLPVAVARLLAGVPLAGSRYTSELGAFYQGGLLGRVEHVLPHSAWQLFSTAIPATIVPYLTPLPLTGHWPDLWKVLSWHVTLLALVGAVVWARRHRDALPAMVALYLVESASWPYVNERRAILVLPVLIGWYVLGAATVWTRLRARMERRAPRPRHSSLTLAVATLLPAAVVAAPLVAQMPRDYLFGWGQSSSRFGGSRYVAMLGQLGPPSAVVETDYRSSTALFTGHRTKWTAFLDTQGLCYLPGILHVLGQDRADYLLLGDFNKPFVLDSPCLAGVAANSDWAVPLLHTRRDSASVFELVGPETGHPGLTNPVPGQRPTVVSSPRGGTAVLNLGRPTPVSQVSLGQAGLQGAPAGSRVTSVSVQIELPDGRWQTVAASASAVGGGPGAAPFLLARFAQPRVAVAVRAVVSAATGGGSVVVGDFSVIAATR